ncbi:sterile alpha motif domain-containing protein 15-like [Boleophthalmus pectinirostris]|uniref:sterile alpha motif domain-containing protein 15-like n=1 Tax=Boleophthalmus pectinirostris TaxID=150288 RepID=UPI000A1C6059|nr:sterile alpha motif domain-containing protein 15-like [Boleophthalmus pectinirostris]
MKESLASSIQTENFYFLHWSCQDAAMWIESLGFPQYKKCFTENFISGRKLIHVNCSNLPKLGITDFNHMKVICGHVRELLGITETPWSQSIVDPPQDVRALYLEQKSPTGAKADRLTYQQFTSSLQH